MKYKALPTTEEMLKKHLFLALYNSHKYRKVDLKSLLPKYKIQENLFYYTKQALDIIMLGDETIDKRIIQKWGKSAPFEEIIIYLNHIPDSGEQYINVHYDFNKSSDFMIGYTIYFSITLPKDFKKHRKYIEQLLAHYMQFAFDYIPFTQSKIKYIRPRFFYDWTSIIYKQSRYTDTILNIASYMSIISPINRSTDYQDKLLNGITYFKKSSSIEKDVENIYSQITSTDIYSIIESFNTQIEKLKTYTEIQRKAVVRFCREENTGFTSTTNLYKYSVSIYFLYRERLFIALSRQISDKYLK